MNGKALQGAVSVAVSPDKKSVYVASNNSDAVDVFSRNINLGKLTQLSGTAGCVSDTGSGGDCADGTALDDAQSVAVSPEDNSVYVGADDGDAVAVCPESIVPAPRTRPPEPSERVQALPYSSPDVVSGIGKCPNPEKRGRALVLPKGAEPP